MQPHDHSNSFTNNEDEETILPFIKDQAAITRFPTATCKKAAAISDQEKIELIADRFKDIMEILGLDLEDPSLAKTPLRVAKMYVNEVFAGLQNKNFPELTFVPNEYSVAENGNMVFLKVGFHSFCEHHFVPMNGTVHVAYLPNEKLIGLSKIPRIVRFFAKRPQLQERLTAQIADCLALVLDTENVAVTIQAEHFCVMARGVEDCGSHTITNVLLGKFDNDLTLRREFFEAVNRCRN